jgi:hypothetical protein
MEKLPVIQVAALPNIVMLASVVLQCSANVHHIHVSFIYQQNFCTKF